MKYNINRYKRYHYQILYDRAREFTMKVTQKINYNKEYNFAIKLSTL